MVRANRCEYRMLTGTGADQSANDTSVRVGVSAQRENLMQRLDKRSTSRGVMKRMGERNAHKSGSPIPRTQVAMLGIVKP